MKIASVPFPKTNYLKTNKDLIRIHRWINYSPWDQVFFDDADIIIIPYVFSKGSASPFVVRESMEAFIYLFFSPAETKKRFIVLDNDDSDSPYDFLKSHFVFKTSANYRHKEIFPLPYNAIIPRYPIPSIEESEFDLSFQGSLITHPIRKQLEIWRRTWKMLKIDFIANDKPYWSYSRQEQCQLQQSYIEQIYKSKFVLCPRGRALNSRRFFETLAYGRIPILLSDAVKLPLEHIIDYSRFCIRVPEGYGRWLPDYLFDFLGKNCLNQASQLAQSTYLKYFSCQTFREFIELSLTGKLI